MSSETPDQTVRRARNTIDRLRAFVDQKKLEIETFKLTKSIAYVSQLADKLASGALKPQVKDFSTDIAGFDLPVILTPELSEEEQRMEIERARRRQELQTQTTTQQQQQQAGVRLEDLPRIAGDLGIDLSRVTITFNQLRIKLGRNPSVDELANLLTSAASSSAVASVSDDVVVRVANQEYPGDVQGIITVRHVLDDFVKASGKAPNEQELVDAVETHKKLLAGQTTAAPGVQQTISVPASLQSIYGTSQIVVSGPVLTPVLPPAGATILDPRTLAYGTILNEYHPELDQGFYVLNRRAGGTYVFSGPALYATPSAVFMLNGLPTIGNQPLPGAVPITKYKYFDRAANEYKVVPFEQLPARIEIQTAGGYD